MTGRRFTTLIEHLRHREDAVRARLARCHAQQHALADRRQALLDGRQATAEQVALSEHEQFLRWSARVDEQVTTCDRDLQALALDEQALRDEVVDEHRMRRSVEFLSRREQRAEARRRARRDAANVDEQVATRLHGAHRRGGGWR
ncbi:MAG: hypothetical protein ACYTF0_03010 [Planctomycetota bacterium]|jgi:hypothetical protein